MRRVVMFFVLAATGLYGQEETPDQRLRASTAVLHEIMSAPDRGIPKDVLDKAQCVVIVPDDGEPAGHRARESRRQT